MIGFIRTVFLKKYNTCEAMEQILSEIEFVSARQSLDEFKQILLNHGYAICFTVCSHLNRFTAIRSLYPVVVYAE